MRYTTPAIDKDIVESMSKVLQEQVIPKGLELSEAAQVHTKQYSWGKLKTVQAGNAASVVLHPEHHKAIGALKDGESHDFQDETRTKWKAARKGDDVHFTTDKISGKIVAKHAHIAEEVDLEEEIEQIDEASTYEVHDPKLPRSFGGYKITNGKKVGTDGKGNHIISGGYRDGHTGGTGAHKHRLYIVSADGKTVIAHHATNDEKVHKAAISYAKKKTEGSYWSHDNHPEKDWYNVDHKVSSVSKSSKLKEEVEQIDELSGATLGSYIQKAHADTAARREKLKAIESQPKVAAAHAKYMDAISYKPSWKQGSRKSTSPEAKEKLFRKAEDEKKKVDPNYPASTNTYKRHQGIKRAVERLTTGKKLTEEQQAIIDELMIVAEQMDLEESQQIDEAFFNHRTAGSHGIIHRDSAARFYKTGEHVDFYDHRTGDKQHGKVTKNDGKEVHILHAGKTKKYKLSNTYPGHGDED